MTAFRPGQRLRWRSDVTVDELRTEMFLSAPKRKLGMTFVRQNPPRKFVVNFDGEGTQEFWVYQDAVVAWSDCPKRKAARA